MRNPLGLPIRRVRGKAPPSDEVARVRALYLASLKRRVRRGTYFTPARVRTAMERLFQALLDDSRP